MMGSSSADTKEPAIMAVLAKTEESFMITVAVLYKRKSSK